MRNEKENGGACNEAQALTCTAYTRAARFMTSMSGCNTLVDCGQRGISQCEHRALLAWSGDETPKPAVHA